MSATVPLLLAPSQLTILVLSAIKVELSQDFPGALLRYSMHRQVGEVILSLTTEQIHMLGSASSHQNLLRVAKADCPSFWSDLAQGLVNEDRTAVHLSLVHSLLGGIPQQAAA